MKELLLVAAPPDGEHPPGALATEYGPAGEARARRVVVHWEGWDAPPGEISLAARLREELTAIRAEHMAWAHDMGRMRVEGREVQHWLACGESLSLWWCSLLYERHPKMTPGLYAVYKLRALERLMDAEGFTALRLYGGDSALRRTLADFCRASGRRFAQSRDAAPGAKAAGLLRRFYEAAPAPLRALARYAHWWWTVRRKLMPAAASLLPTRTPAATIATYFPNVDMQAAKEGRFRSRYWESLHDALDGAARREGGHFVRWLFVRFPAPGLDLAQCLELRDRFRKEGRDGASFHYLEEFLRHRDLWAAFWRHARLCVASLRVEKSVQPAFCFSGSRLNFWEYLGGYWAESFRGWRGLERCLQQRALQRYAACAGKQRWTLFPLENCPWERMLTQAVHQAGNGPVYGAQHSSLRPTDFRYFDDKRTFAGQLATFQPDTILGNGSSACGQWLAAHLPAERLGTTEALRYLYLADETPSPEHSAPPHGKRLLAVTSFFADETQAHLELLARALRAGLLDGWEVRVKPHPYLPVRERLHALLGSRADAIFVEEGPIAGCLQAGVVVWASNSTTVVLEAALKGLPVMAMLPLGDFDLCPLQDVADLPRTGTLDHVAAALNTATPLNLPADYLCLDPALPRWKKLLGLEP